MQQVFRQNFSDAVIFFTPYSDGAHTSVMHKVWLHILGGAHSSVKQQVYLTAHLGGAHTSVMWV